MTNPADNAHPNSIAIIGMAGSFPKAPGIAEFWRLLRDGVEAISFISEDELIASGVSAAKVRNPNYVRAKGVLEGADLFDASFFGYNPREAEVIDLQQRVFLECAWSALEAAGYGSEKRPSAIGVFAGARASTYLWNLLLNSELVEDVGFFQISLGNDRDYISTRVSYELNLKGPSFNVQTGCSTSLVAVHLACQSLLDYQCDMALAGGVSITLPLKGGYLYKVGGIASPDGHCRAFDEQAQGTVPGNGVGIVVLKRLTDALSDGDTIRAVIKGTAINNDGSAKIGFTAPSVEGQAEVIAEAQASAGISPDEISYVETHGTATQLGDPIEVAALAQVFNTASSRPGSCAIGSVKTNLGHLDAAAGVAGLIKTVLSLEHRLIAPSLHFSRPNPRCDLSGTPFYVPQSARPWEAGKNGEPRRAGVSSFGIGGTNAHVIVEEAPAAGPSAASRLPAQVLVLSAKSEVALEGAARRLSDHLAEHKSSAAGKTPDAGWLADVAYTLQLGRTAMSERLAVVCRSVDEGIAALEAWSQKKPVPTIVRGRANASPPRIIMLFPGQGSHYAGMCRELYDALPVFRREFDVCIDAVKRVGGPDLRRVVTSGLGQDEMKHTALAQPVLWAIEVALARVWEEWGVKPWGVAGHSLGEVAAAVCAGVMDLEAGARVVVRRGELMEAAGAGGSMIAISLSEREVRTLLNTSRVDVAAINAPRQCVLSGPQTAVAEVIAELNCKEIGWRDLGTTYAFHSEMMDAAVAPLVEEVKRLKLSEPKLAMISGVTGKWAEPEEVTSAEYWGRQLRQPVQFSAAAEELLKSLGAGGVLLEVGPGRTLCSLVEKHLTPEARKRVVLQASLFKKDEETPEVVSLLQALGQLWVAGSEGNWEALHKDERRRRVPLPTYSFQRQRYWIDAQPLENLQHAHAQSLSKKEGIADWFYVPIWKQSTAGSVRAWRTASSANADQARNYLLFTDECGLGSRLASRLRDEGQNVNTVRIGSDFRRVGASDYSIAPERREHYEALLRELRARDRAPEIIVHLWNVTANDQVSSAVEWLDQSQQCSFYSLVYLAQALGEQVLGILPDASSDKKVRLYVVSNGLQSVAGEPFIQPEKAMLLGPCRVIGQEYEDVSCSSVDIILPTNENSWQELLDQLSHELAVATDETTVAYRGGHRWVRAYDPVRLEGRALPARLRPRGVYLLTGGTGGIGMALASYLARTVQARLILLSRSAPKAEQVSDLERLGAQVLWVCADVSDERQMRAAVQEARRKFGEINGVIHAAGVPGGGFIQLMRPEVAEATIVSKVKGTLVLQEVLAEESLDFTILFSSLRSILGGHGRVDYCAANSFLDAFARAKATGDAPFTCSIIWDGWREVGMAVDAARRSNLEPEDGMLTEEGIEAFARVLDGRWPEIVVSTRDLARIIEENKAITISGKLDQLNDKRTAQPAHARPNIDTSYVAPQTETERIIAEIWQQLLGIEKVGVDDNFFELGGDSVLTIQIIAKTNKAGLRLTPQQVFEHQTIAALAAVAGTGEVVMARQDVVTGAVPLTPVQYWFTELATTDPHHWNQSLLLETRKPLDASLLKQALESVMAHHDALRIRFTIDESGWRQYNAAFDGQVPFAYHDLSMLPEKKQTATIEAAATEAQASLDLTTGPLLRVSFFDTGPGKPGRLLLIAHHLVMDAISLRFVLEDFATAYEQAARSEPISLPAKTTSFKTWAEMLVEHAQSADVAGELEYWLADERQGMFPLPIDVEDGRRLNTEESARTFRVALDAEETRALLQDVPHVYHTQINDVLMTALALALRHWTDQSLLLVDLEGHGRDAIFKGTDVTRTVGWFTTIYPVLLELDAGWGVGEALKRVKEQLHRLPGRGFSYGLLRYLHQDLKIRERLRQVPRAEVSFLYLGQLDEALRESTPFVPAAESRGPTVSPRATRSHLLMISGFVAGGRLQLDWTYSVNVHCAATVEQLAEGYLQSLRDIVRHCSEAGAGGFTPSDFPAAELSQEELDQLIQDLSHNHIGAGEAV